MKKISMYFLNGLLIIAPLAATAYLIAVIFNKIDILGAHFLTRLDQRIPGLGFISVMVLITLIGFLANIWVSKKLIRMLESLLGKTPVVKSIYGVLKDTLASFIGEKKSFDTVVLVNTGGGGRRLGFLTVKEPVFNAVDRRPYLGVYFPQSMQFAGDLFFYPANELEIVDIPPETALRIILSAGMAGKDNEPAENLTGSALKTFQPTKRLFSSIRNS